MQVLSLVNQKGGCGKTTVAVNLAGALALRGLRALLVDLDPQAHATMALGCSVGDGRSLIDVLAGRAGIDDVIIAAAGSVWLLPASARLADFEDSSARTIHPERVLAGALAAHSDVFDVAILDCPPRVDGVLALSALRASTTAILVVETGAFALQGAVQAQKILDEVQKQEEHAFRLRVLATMFDRRMKLEHEILVALQARFGDALFDTVIRRNARLREAAALGAPVQVVDPASKSAADFAALAEELCADEPGLASAPPIAYTSVARGA
jgi:chromosome partitioning protein